MQTFKPKGFKHGPEHKIQQDIIKMLLFHGWYVKVMHGSVYQAGFPDLFTCHYRYGIRLIEVKDPNRRGDVFTAAQHEEFPKITANGGGIWVMVDATEKEYNKLFDRPNWYQYLQAFK